MPADLAEKLDVEEPAARKAVTRLRDRVRDRLTVDQGVILPKGFIENVHGTGYRLSPELREVSLRRPGPAEGGNVTIELARRHKSAGKMPAVPGVSDPISSQKKSAATI